MMTKEIQDKVYLNELKLQDYLKYWKAHNKKIVFTNGCFDIIHRGHIEYLCEAKEKGDILIVGLNSDDSVRKLKGETRPINDQMSRALILASLLFVDAVVIFDEETPLNLIKMINPNVLVKGGDYKKEDIIGYDFVKENNGEILTIDIVLGYSTTKIINENPEIMEYIEQQRQLIEQIRRYRKTKEQKDKYNKIYRTKNRDELNKKRREKYLMDKLNRPVVDKPKQVRKKRTPKTNKLTENIQEYQKIYREKNKKEKPIKQKIEKVKPIKQKIEKVKPIKQKIEKAKPVKERKYTNSQEIEEQIFESLKSGQITDKLANIMLKIANGISNRLKYSDMDLKYDCKAAGLEAMLTQYHKYSSTNTNCNAFAYLSEICKRGMAGQFNEFNYKKYGVKLNVINFDYWK